MPFGEYELSPSLIGLSLLHTPHPEAFQRLLVGASIPCYRDFTLDMRRSLGFASATADYAPSSGSLSLRIRRSCGLASPATATRRFIMQKARRHFTRKLRPLVGAWFQVLFHSPHRGAFHRSLTVLSAIGLTGVFSLAGWSRRIRAGFHVSRVTQDTARSRLASRTGLSPSVTELSRTFRSRYKYHGAVLQPRHCVATAPVWALPRSLATTGGIISLFSLPAGTKMFQFPALASVTHILRMTGLQPDGLSHSDTPGSTVMCT